jgi:phosphoenolpyruvate phosphomutase
MGNVTSNNPKCMTEIGNGFTIISWQLDVLEKSGIREVIITTGPFAEKLEDYVTNLNKKMDIKFVYNPDFLKTNYIYSMSCAKDCLDDDCVILHGDIVVEQSVIEELIKADKSCISVDKLLPLPEKDFKAKIINGKVTAVGIEFFGEDCEACQPAYKFVKNDLKIWLDEVEKFCNNEIVNVYAENAFNEISDKVNVFPMELNSRLCNEIDCLEDLKTISQRFLKIVGKREI